MYWERVADKVRAFTVQRSQAHRTRRRDGNAARADDQDASRRENW